MLSKAFHRGRREAFASVLKNNTMELIESGSLKQEVGDQNYPFVPDMDFYYLTGLELPDAYLAAVKRDGVCEYTLFIKRTDRRSARWTGEDYNITSIRKLTGIKNIRYNDTVGEFIESNRKGLKLKKKHSDLSGIRYIKTKEEIECHRKAAEITAEGVDSILRNLRPGMYEYEIEAYFDFALKSRNAGHAFSTIAASGKNACVLHYDRKDSLINNGDMILFDLGASWKHYCCDLSRTYPANGKFTKQQRQLYNIVLDGLKAAEEAAVPGVCKNDLQYISKDVMTKELMDAGFIKKPKDIDKYYCHGSGHYIGLFTHDVGDNNAPLCENMMFTLEPGLYFDELSLGIRIEDTLLVTKDGVDILTGDIPKEPDDIEKIMNH